MNLPNSSLPVRLCLPRLLWLLALLPALASLRAADDKIMAAVRAADDERIAATVAADRNRLAAVYSDDLSYSHSTGRVDTKTSQIEGIVAGGNKYDSYEHKTRTIVPLGPNAAMVKGRVLIHMTAKKTGEKATMDLNYLAVWRQENGKWRFLAWQSCKNPAPDAAKK